MLKLYKNIKSIKLALMKKTSSVEILDDNKKNYIITTSGKLDVPKLLETKKYHKFSDKKFTEFIGEALSVVFDELWKYTKEDQKLDIKSIGLWIDYGGRLVDNSIDINVLKKIEEYGTSDIKPMLEFYIMTLDK